MKMLDIDHLEDKVGLDKKQIGATITFFLALTIAALLMFNQSRAIEVSESMSPTGEELNSSSDYRFSNVDGEIMYGPYIEKEDKYYYYDGNVLNSNYKQVENKDIENLHKFYLQTYTDPLYYAPGSEEDMNLSGFEQFEKYKILTKECGLEYDMVPQKFFNNLSKNHEATDVFLQKASKQNAQRLVSQNRETVRSYSSYIGSFIDNLNREVWMNECFDNETRNNGFSRATLTEPQYMIDTEIMANYSRMANENARKSLDEVNAREQLLENGGKVNYTYFNQTVANYNYSYADLMSPERAKDEMHTRIENEEKQAIEHLVEIENGEDEENHTHPHGSNTSQSQEEEEINYSNVDVDLELPEINTVPRLYDINSTCLGNEYAPVYGWNKNVYPNLMMGSTDYMDSAQRQLWDFFTVCRCPYVEISRLKWYAIDDTYNRVDSGEKAEEISEDSKKARRIFLENPGDKTLSQMAKSYENDMVSSIENNEYNSDMARMWEVSQKSNSKMNYLKTTYNDFYSEQHMKVWASFFDVESDTNQHARYNYFLLQESLYSLTFMTWSDSAWRLDDKPKKLGEELDYDHHG